MTRFVIAALLVSASTVAFGAPSPTANRDDDKCPKCTATIVTELQRANAALAAANAKLEKLVTASQATPSTPDAPHEDRPMIFRGTNATAGVGNYGLLTTNTAGVQSGPIKPIGHLFRNSDAVPAEKFFAIWENTETQGAGATYNGVTYQRTVPPSSGKLVGYVSASEPAGGGVAVNIAEQCKNYSFEGAIVDPSMGNGFLGCASVRRLGWIAK